MNGIDLFGLIAWFIVGLGYYNLGMRKSMDDLKYTGYAIVCFMSSVLFFIIILIADPPNLYEKINLLRIILYVILALLWTNVSYFVGRVFGVVKSAWGDDE